MNGLLLVFFFVLGTIVGSFLNVVILRFGAKSTNGRSQCLSCAATLRWYELIPLCSFVAQCGRCRSCGSRISLQYPLVELLVGLVFALVFWKESFSLSLPLSLVLWSLLIIIAVYDLRHKIIPAAPLYAAISLSFLSLLFAFRFSLFAFRSLDFWGGLLIPLPFALIWLSTGGRAMGLGDAKLLVIFSWLLGFAQGLSALALGFWFGAGIALLLLLLRSKRFTMKTELPLAPFLILGLLVVYLTGVDVTGLTLLLS